MAESALRDRHILVVEDEYLIASTLSDQLEGVGSIVVGPIPSVEKAIKEIGEALREAERRVAETRAAAVSAAAPNHNLP